MKKNIIRSVKLLTLLSLLFFGVYSCVDDSLNDLEIRRIIEEEIRKNNQDLEFTQWKIVPITVRESDWEWVPIERNDDEGRFEAIFDLPELTEFIYEDGAQIASVFIGEQGVDEVQKPLPYVKTYPATDLQNNAVTFTETISCDFQYGSPSTVAFHIEASDLGKDLSAMADYNFRIILIW